MGHCRDTKCNEWHAQLGAVNSSHQQERLCRNVHFSRPGFVSRLGLAALSTTLPDLLDSLLLHSFKKGRLSLAKYETLARVRRSFVAQVRKGRLSLAKPRAQQPVD